MKYTLELPWGFPKRADIYYDRERKTHVYKGGSILPAELRPYASDDFSYSRWQEDEMNGFVQTPEKGAATFKPRPHQLDAAKKIYKSYNENWRGFLLADSTGLGKTLSTLAGITAIAKQEGFGVKKKGTLLVVCPKSVIPQWRQTIHNYPVSSAFLRVLIINYQQLNKLLQAPATARVVKKARTKNRQTAAKGVPIINWDYIVFDEAHSLKNYPTSTTSVAASNLAQLEKPYEKKRAPFVIYSTATPGASPLNLSVMAGILAPLISDNPTAQKITPSTWGKFLALQKFAISEGKNGWVWITVPGFGKNSDNPAEQLKYRKALQNAKKLQRQDSQRIGRGLIKPHAPFIMRSPKEIAGWPEQLPVPFPIQLTTKQRPIYEEAWTIFRSFLNLSPSHRDPKTALVETLRYRQKSSLLKVDSTAEFVQDLVNAGNQVFISCEFMETIDRYREILEAKKIRVNEISGRNPNDREIERNRFQKGEVDVVLCTVVAGISLHAGEILNDGTKATATPRVTVIHDIRQNNLNTEQAMGRAHRDGENSITYFPYIEKTVEEKVIASYTNKTANMKAMTGATMETAEQYEMIFREAAARSTAPNRLS